jgi:hypothetical protein
MAGNSSRLAMALRSAADGFAAEDATSSIASMRLLSQTVPLHELMLISISYLPPSLLDQAGVSR